MSRRFPFAGQFALAIAILLPASRATFADEGNATTINRPAWELTPYRVELCVIVEPSARLLPALEAELSQQLVAQAEATLGGPWQVTANQKVVTGQSRMLRELPLLNDPQPLKTAAGIDKVIVIAVQEAAADLRVTAREWDAGRKGWNPPVQRTVAQASRVSAEAFGALQAAWGPLLRIDSVDKETVSVTLRAGSLPRRDGTFLSIDRTTPFAPYILQTDKEGKSKPETVAVVPGTFLLPFSTPGAGTSGGASRGSFKCRLHTALSGSPLPDYHPLQPRLAIGLPKSIATTRLMLVDQESPQPPLEGYEVYLAPLETAASAPAPQRIGVTGRNGEVEIPAGDGTLRRLIIKHGGEELARRPFLPGMAAEIKLQLPSDRRRLELAAEFAAAEDELVDTLGRLAILGARVQDALAKRDVALVGRMSSELKNAAGMSTLTNRISALERQLASADEPTRLRLAPLVARLKQDVEGLKAQFAGGQ